MDADGQHDPEEIPKFMNALDTHDIVFGCRQIPKTMPLVFRFGNKVISKTMHLLYNINVHDSQCGYRAFTADAYKKYAGKRRIITWKLRWPSRVGKKKTETYYETDRDYLC